MIRLVWPLLLALAACSPRVQTDASAGVGDVDASQEEFVPFDEPPVLDKWVTPYYPEYARDHQMEGMVKVRVTVKASGGVEDVKVMESSNRIFDEAALEAARQWRFKPARKDGKKVRAAVIVPVKFSL
ncbi:MAG: energy transducer TonB [Candidatus Krumholzibacteria bacterium]|nr:energy transducer TonB [Candidatus Krumholzibacteria bacterium]MDH4338200.1 energy transducer TonB [Candidatus Krumholzibacteria bacterium]MDH5270875.1 energy transducer TonB [Candidatus Krumholzibacteria bacterium]